MLVRYQNSTESCCRWEDERQFDVIGQRVFLARTGGRSKCPTSGGYVIVFAFLVRVMSAHARCHCSVIWVFSRACCQHTRGSFADICLQRRLRRRCRRVNHRFAFLPGTVGTPSTPGAGIFDGDRPGHGEDLVGRWNQQGLRDVVGPPLPGKRKPFPPPYRGCCCGQVVVPLCDVLLRTLILEVGLD